MSEIKTIVSASASPAKPSWFEETAPRDKEIPRDDPRAITPTSEHWARTWCVYEKKVDVEFHYRQANMGSESGSPAQDRVTSIGLEMIPSVRRNAIGIKLDWRCKSDLGWGLKQGWTDPNWGINLTYSTTRQQKYAGDFYEGHTFNSDGYSFISLHVKDCPFDRFKKILDLHCQVCDIDRKSVVVLEECYKRGLPVALAKLEALKKESKERDAKYAQDLADREAKNALAATVENARRQEANRVAEVNRNVTIKAMWEKYRQANGTQGYPAPEYYTKKWLPRLTQAAIDHFIETGEI